MCGFLSLLIVALVDCLCSIFYCKVVKEVIDPQAKIEFKENTADDPHKRKPDITRAKELLHWEPKVDLKDGLPLMVEDFRRRILEDPMGSQI